MTDEGTIFCTNCGHQHASRPASDVCEGCGASFVVDLANPTRAEVERAVHTKPRQSPGPVVGALVVIGVLAVSMTAVILVLRAAGSRVDEEPEVARKPLPRIIGLIAAKDPPTPEQLEERRRKAQSLTEGPLTKEAIQAVVNHNIASMQRCYEERLLDHPGLAGKVTMQWRINSEGTPEKVEATSDTLPDPAVARCIIEQVKTWRFPKAPPEGTQVNYPFMFKSIQ